MSAHDSPLTKALTYIVARRVVALERALEIEPHVVDNCGHEVVREVAFTKVFDFFEKYCADVVEGLVAFGHTDDDEGALVGEVIEADTCAEHALRQVDVDVNETAFVVVEHLKHELDDEHVGVFGCGEAPCQVKAFCLLTEDFDIDRLDDFGFSGEVEDGQVVVGLEVTEIFCDDVDHVVGVKVAGDADSHVVGDIPLFVVVLDVGD